ncbi:MAG: hypothetical protein AAB973_03120 [Patescibacteria group bacterium]
MEFSRQFAAWKWIIYPVVVIGAILASFPYVAGDSGVGGNLIQQSRQLKIDEERVAALREKLTNLKSVNLESELALGEYLYAAVPAKPQYGLLFRELSEAASQTGVIVTGYRGARKSGVVVVLAVGDVGKLGVVIEQLERSLPLLTVSQVKYGEGEAELTLETAAVGISGTPAGGMVRDAAAVKKKLEGFIRF